MNNIIYVGIKKVFFKFVIIHLMKNSKKKFKTFLNPKELVTMIIRFIGLVKLFFPESNHFRFLTTEYQEL